MKLKDIEAFLNFDIDALRKQTGADLPILERTVFAFGFQVCLRVDLTSY